LAGADTRQVRLVEALEVITMLFGGGYVNHHGPHFDIDSAKLRDLPDVRVPIGVAVSGRQSGRSSLPTRRS